MITVSSKYQNSFFNALKIAADILKNNKKKNERLNKILVSDGHLYATDCHRLLKTAVELENGFYTIISNTAKEVKFIKISDDITDFPDVVKFFSSNHLFKDENNTKIELNTDVSDFYTDIIRNISNDITIDVNFIISLHKTIKDFFNCSLTAISNNAIKIDIDSVGELIIMARKYIPITP